MKDQKNTSASVVMPNIFDMVTGAINATAVKEATYTEREDLYNAYVTEYRNLGRTAVEVGTAYSLRAGRILKAIKDKKLYEVGGYKGLGDFAKSVLDVSPATATNSIKVVEMIDKNEKLPDKLELDNLPYKLLVAFASEKYAWEQKKQAITEYRDGKSVNAVIDVMEKNRTLSEKETKRLADKEAEKKAYEEQTAQLTETINNAVKSARDMVESGTVKSIETDTITIGLPTPEQYARVYTQLKRIVAHSDALKKVTMVLDSEYNEATALETVFMIQEVIAKEARDKARAEAEAKNEVVG